MGFLKSSLSFKNYVFVKGKVNDVAEPPRNPFIILPLLNLIDGLQRTNQNHDFQPIYPQYPAVKSIPSYNNWNLQHVPKSIISSFFESMNSAYQELINRQQAFINLITCGNCVNDGWTAIMSSAANVPSLEWLFKPGPPNTSTGASFFAATNHNGIVTGVGGSIVESKPVVEFTFSNQGPNPQQVNATANGKF